MSMSRLGFVVALMFVVASAGPAGGSWAGPPSAGVVSRAATGVRAVARVGITVGDLDRSLAFYRDTLGFELAGRSEAAGDAVERLSGVFAARRVSARLRLGDEEIELTQYLAPEGRPIPADSRSHDAWFQHIAIVVSDMDRAYAHLRSRGVRHASSGPQTLPDWNVNAGGISAFYFKDPEGHVLEVIHFPPGRGDEKWHRPTDRLFLGIDHTAIVVGDTERSLAFYRDALGMRVAGASENFGGEQEHLNAVFGARLRITALRAPCGPGVELLEYLSPSDGRPYPRDARACDLIHWQTVLAVDDAEEASTLVRSGGGRWISPGAVGGLDASSGMKRAVLGRDPDGHAVLFMEAAEPSEARERSRLGRPGIEEPGGE